MSCENPIFILGAGSSGTTLLGVMLDRHTQIACGPEIYFFDKAELYGEFESVKEKMPHWLDQGIIGDGQVDSSVFMFNREAYFQDKKNLTKTIQNATQLKDVSDTFFDHYLGQRKKKRWAEKTGSNAYCMNEILKMYPNARMIHLVRDGRDVACSMFKRSGSMYHSVSHWLYNVSAAVRFRQDPRYLEVRYEDLVNAPELTLKKICEHLAIKFESKMLQSQNDAYWKNQKMGNVHDTWTQNPFSCGVSNRSVGRYKTDLAEQDTWLFWRMMLTSHACEKLNVSHQSTGDLMAMFGYDCSESLKFRRLGLADYRQGLALYRKRFRLEKLQGRANWKPLTRPSFLGISRHPRSHACAV